MIAVPINHDTSLHAFGSPLHYDSISSGSHGTARSPQFGTEIINAIRLFVVQALDIGEDTSPFSKTGHSHQYRDTVDNTIAIHFHAPQTTTAMQCHRFTLNPQIGPHSPKNLQQLLPYLIARPQT